MTKWLPQSFQELLKLIRKTFTGRKGQGASYASYKEFKKQAKRFSNYPFAPRLFAWIKEQDEKLFEIFNSKRGKNTKSSELSQASSALESAFRKGDIAGAFAMVPRVNNLLNSMKGQFVKPDDYIKEKKNPFYIENPLFFSRNGLLNQFEDDDMDHLISLDLNKFCYSYLPIPDRKRDDFEYLVYWMDKLQTSMNPVELTVHEFNFYSKFKFDSYQYDEVLQLADKYLSSNNKQALTELLTKMKEIPELWQKTKR
jgi:hypothetical protein